MFGYNWIYSLLHPLEMLVLLYKHIKWFLQRGYRGYADCDVWSLDYYLSGWLPEALAKLKANKLGCPIGLTPKKWANILEIMIIGFKVDKRLANYEFRDLKQAKQYQKASDRGLALFAKYYRNLWD